MPDLTPGYVRSPLGLLIPAQQRRIYDRPVGIDLFAGAGGFSCGMHQAGFHIAAALEMDPWAAITYAVNLGRPIPLGGMQFHYDTDERGDAFEKVMQKHMGIKAAGSKNGLGSAGATRPVKGKLTRPGLRAGEGWIAGYGRPHNRADFPNEFLADINKPPTHQDGCEHLWVADVRNITGAEILDTLDIEVGDVAVVFGGPPCQGFSAAGKRNVMDPRNSLIFEFARLICEIRPRTFVMENVPAIESMVTPEGIPVLDAFALAVADGGYGEYDALRRALSSMGGKAAVREAKRAKKHNGDSRAAQPTRKTRAAVAANRDGDQLDLFPDVAKGGTP